MTIDTPFADRRAAGAALARRLEEEELAAPVVLAMPRGGVAVAVEIARRLAAPLDLVLVRKIGVPYHSELAAAAVVDGGEAELVINEDVVALLGVSREDIEAQAARELEEIERRRKVYLKDRSRVALAGRTIILVDDGIATGASVRAALRALKRQAPKQLILAVPVAPAETLAVLRDDVDRIVCLRTPEPFFAIGEHYLDFHQLDDAEVTALLAALPGGEARQPTRGEDEDRGPERG
jgi:putative phosphoribosyl transferase